MSVRSDAKQEDGATIRSVKDGCTMFLKTNFYGVDGNFVVDTGSAVTLMSLAFYYNLPPSKRPELRKPATNLKFEVANDELLEVSGVATFEFKLRNDVYKWDMNVAPIREDGWNKQSHV